MRTEPETAVGLVREDAVAILTLDNPPVNSMTERVLGELGERVDDLARDGDVRAVVLTGSGDKAFAAGADVAELQTIMASDGAVDAHTAITRRVLGAIAALPQPVVAGVQASAVGGGLELALVCDFIVADERARLGLPEVKLGLIPGAGGTQRLARRLGAAKALELVVLGRLLPAADAAAIGLVTDVAPAGEALERATQLAAELAALPARAVRAAKHAVHEGAALPLPAALELERQQFAATLRSRDAREGVSAFLERRAPVFTHR